MTISITLQGEEERRLAEHAARSGLDVTDFVRGLIRRELARTAPIDAILAPFRREVAESGMTDEELGEFFEQARDEVWDQKYPKRPEC